MIYIENNSLDPYWNFALEYYLITDKIFEEDTVFLLWRTEPTLMIGKYQNAYEEINMNFVERNNVNVVRRMSGGGTVYTDMGGWQYSFIEKEKENGIGFTKFITPVVDVLRDMGVEANFSGRNDLMAEGKKISGNAQYKHNGCTIHHGTLLFDSDLNKLAESVKPDEKKITSKGIKSVSERVTNISTIMKEKIHSEQFRDEIITGILGKEGEKYELSMQEKARIDEIADEKFRPWEIVYGSFPKCNMTKTSYFSGGKMECNMDIQAGKIENIRINGDYFCTENLDNLYELLKGCKYDRESITKILRTADIDTIFYNISTEDVLNAIL